MKFWMALIPFVLVACPEEPGRDAGPRVDAQVDDAAVHDDVYTPRDVQFPPQDTGPGCGDVPTIGVCGVDGVLSWCESNAVRTADCPALGLDCGHSNDLGGYWCLADVGESCSNWPCYDGLDCGHSRICSGVLLDAGVEDAARED